MKILDRIIYEIKRKPISLNIQKKKFTRNVFRVKVSDNLNVGISEIDKNYFLAKTCNNQKVTPIDIKDFGDGEYELTFNNYHIWHIRVIMPYFRSKYFHTFG